jgi:hypothetical protein
MQRTIRQSADCGYWRSVVGIWTLSGVSYEILKIFLIYVICVTEF